MEIRVYAKQIKGERKDGGKFNFLKFSYTKDGKKFLDVKFTKDSGVNITEQGYYLIDLELKDVNRKVGKTVLLNDGREITNNDILWVSKVNAYVRDTEYEKEVQERKLKELAELF